MCLNKAIQIRSYCPIIAARKIDIEHLRSKETKALSSTILIPFSIFELKSEPALLASQDLKEFGYHSTVLERLNDSWLVLIEPTELLFTDGIDLTSTRFKIIMPLYGIISPYIRKALIWDSLSRVISRIVDQHNIRLIHIDKDHITFTTYGNDTITAETPNNFQLDFYNLDKRQARVLRRYWK